ncbi:MAG: hypothetical protein R3Y26_12030 [Rikenellaceae bacterium]
MKKMKIKNIFALTILSAATYVGYNAATKISDINNAYQMISEIEALTLDEGGEGENGEDNGYWEWNELYNKYVWVVSWNLF